MASPISTGGAGTHLESRVAAYYLAMLLSGGESRGLPSHARVARIGLQRAFEGNPLDDVIIHADVASGQVTLSLQVKRTLIFGDNKLFHEVMGECWGTFNMDSFCNGSDRVGVAVGTRTPSFENHGRDVLSWASDSANAGDFLARIQTAKLANQGMRDFCTTIRQSLDNASGVAVDDTTFWQFLKHFEVIEFDFENRESSRDKANTINLLKNCLSGSDKNQAGFLWQALIDIADTAKPSAGSFDYARLSEKLQTSFYIPSNTDSENTNVLDINDATIMEIFGAASQQLLDWPQLTEGKHGEWITRPEMQILHDFIVTPRVKNSTSVNILLGGPGCGKSALLARLGVQLSQDNIKILAIKADTLPKSLMGLDGLDTLYGTPTPILTCLASLADKAPVVILIDQLDALCELMDQHTDRLTILLALINRARRIPNLSIIISCRTFEHLHDVRLNSIDANTVTLNEPSWDEINKIIMARGVTTSSWPQAIKNILCTPQHLHLFLKYLPDDSELEAYRSYQDMLEAIIQKRVRLSHGQNTLNAAMQIATEMAKEEELWLPIISFESDYHDEISRLIEAEILITDISERRISFRHQTIFDFLRARAFVIGNTSLSEYVLTRQETLFIRPTLWSSINYLRAINMTSYHTQLLLLWSNDPLRHHIRLLLIEFLAQVSSPSNQEVRIVNSIIQEPTLRRHFLNSAQKNPDWITPILPQFPTLMSLDEHSSNEITGLLRTATQTLHRQHILELMRQLWLKTHLESNIYYVLRDSNFWDNQSAQLVQEIAHNVHPTFISSIVSNIATTEPELAMQVISAKLWSQLTEIISKNQTPEDAVDHDDTDDTLADEASSHQDNYAIKTLLTSWHDWHDISKVASKAPQLYVEATWTWYTTMFELLSSSDESDTYRQLSGASLAFDDDASSAREMPLITALLDASTAWAKADPSSFHRFWSANEASNLLAVHIVLAKGIAHCAAQFPLEVLNYILSDRKRLTIGNYHNTHAETQSLISAVAPHLENQELAQLEQTILKYDHICDIDPDITDCP